MVNIPAFQLLALTSPQDEHPLTMKVVVGKAKENQTPILWEEMKYLEFMPYWNIPRSIMDKEIVPKIQSDKTYLSSQDIELVENVNDEFDAETNDMGVVHNLKHGLMRARQRPGNKNPLGKVKFIFPNKADVYLHDSPARGAFSRDRRDLSHGCVRVSDAEKLAEFVLGNQPGWSRETIQAAMSGSKTQRVSLKKTIPVLFFYNTAFAGTDNKLRFYPDIYGYDAQLQSALNKSTNQPMLSKTNTTDG
jgi:murein L,D-transpeptidase YcbB/YkuD